MAGGLQPCHDPLLLSSSTDTAICVWVIPDNCTAASRGCSCRLLREPESLLELSGHSHWVWQVAYSPFYNPLLLSSSTDTTVCVWFTPALAKAKGVENKVAAGRTGGGNSRWVQRGCV